MYGQTKREGEKAIIKSGCMYVIIRTAWLYSAFGNNFVKTMLRLGGEREEVQVVSDPIGAPTYAEDLARAILAILDDDTCIEHEGIYHFTNRGTCSWCEFAQEIMSVGEKKCNVIPIPSVEYPTKASRPAYSVLDLSKIQSTFQVEIPEWKEALRRMMDELREGNSF